MIPPRLLQAAWHNASVSFAQSVRTRARNTQTPAGYVIIEGSGAFNHNMIRMAEAVPVVATQSLHQVVSKESVLNKPERDVEVTAELEENQGRTSLSSLPHRSNFKSEPRNICSVCTFPVEKFLDRPLWKRCHDQCQFLRYLELFVAPGTV